METTNFTFGPPRPPPKSREPRPLASGRIELTPVAAGRMADRLIRPADALAMRKPYHRGTDGLRRTVPPRGARGRVSVVPPAVSRQPSHVPVNAEPRPESSHWSQSTQPAISQRASLSARPKTNSDFLQPGGLVESSRWSFRVKGERPPGTAPSGGRTPEGCQRIMLELRLAFGTCFCMDP